MAGDLVADVLAAIKDVPDFPKEGILFKDITPVLEDPTLYQRVVKWMANAFPEANKVVAIESRGFLFGAAMVAHTGAGLVLARKAGKLPRETVSESYDLEYGTATLQMHTDSLKAGDKVVVVDDLLATGGTAKATVKLCEALGAEVVGCLFMIELDFLNGRDVLAPVPTKSLISF